MEVEIGFWTWVKMWLAEQLAYGLLIVGILVIMGICSAVSWLFRERKEGNRKVKP